MKYLLLALLLSGCATLKSPQTLGACALADVVTTAYGVSHGLVIEKNPLLAPSVNAHHFLPLVLSKLAVVGLIWWAYDLLKPNEAMDAGMVAGNVVTCGVAASNLVQILK